jgi:hypothetical protein
MAASIIILQPGGKWNLQIAELCGDTPTHRDCSMIEDMTQPEGNVIEQIIFVHSKW